MVYYPEKIPIRSNVSGYSLIKSAVILIGSLAFSRGKWMSPFVFDLCTANSTNGCIFQMSSLVLEGRPSIAGPFVSAACRLDFVSSLPFSPLYSPVGGKAA